MRLYKHQITTRQAIVLSATVLAVAVAITSVFVIAGRVQPAQAARGQMGTPQVTLNPGGGIESDASDGLRFTINSRSTEYDDLNGHEYDNAYLNGQDGVVYRGTYQYCCGAGAPMLNIGGNLYGQAGAAANAGDWQSIEILATSGVTSVGARTSNTGNSTATIRYIASNNDLEYIMDRTVTYSYPNDYVTDSYSFIIPAGNTDVVKFYLGGDTSPGSSDSGYGIMLTEPVRSVISLNTSSRIMFGFREVPGSRVFDGATSRPYSAPYETVMNGQDIGFIGTPSNHDAGLMMQWNLGSTPGTYTGKFQQFATRQGTNLNASFAEAFADPGDPVDLNISIVNTELYAQTGLGYTFTLPAGLVIDAAATNLCGGTLTAQVGTNTIVLSGVDISSAANCVVTVPVSAEDPGSYLINAASATGLEGVLTNNVGVSVVNVGVYALSFISQGGTSIDDLMLEEGDTTTIPNVVRPGFNFIEWNTAVDGSGTSYDPGDIYVMTLGGASLYAQWDAIPFDLIFNEQGGDVESDHIDITTGDLITLPSSYREGYRFIEWNTAADGSGTDYRAQTEFSMPPANVTLYAIWALELTVSYDPQGGDALSPSYGIAGDQLGLQETYRNGYGFVGWNTQANGLGTTYPAWTSYTISSSVTLYAMWEVQYQLTYDPQFGEESEPDTEWYSAEEDVWLYESPSRSSFYTFVEWNTAADGSGDAYEDDEDGFIMPAAAVTLYAIWEESDPIDAIIENAGPNSGDANNDGLKDSAQANVSSFVNPITNKPVVLAITTTAENECALTDSAVVTQASLGVDETYEYPAGLLDFVIDCDGEAGYTATITQYFYDLAGSDFILRKFIDNKFITVEDATFQTQTIDGRQVLVVSYEVTDGGVLDADGEENGVIVDPAGPAVLPSQVNAGTPNTGFSTKSNVVLYAVVIGGFVSLLASLGLWRLLAKRTT